MGNVYGLNGEGIRDLREIKRRVLQAPLNAGPQRARWPVGGAGPQPQRFKITELTSGTGTGTSPTGTAVYRTSHPAGLFAQKVDQADTPDGNDQLIYADLVRSVFVTNDVIWAIRRAGRWQIRDEGRLTWLATANEDLVNGYYGQVRLANTLSGAVDVPARIVDTADSVSEGSTCLVHWIDGSQEFIALPIACPSPVISYA